MPFPETADAQADFKAFSESIVATLAKGYDRQPPKFLLEGLRALSPEPGVFEGPEKSRRKLEALGRQFQTEYNAVKRRTGRKMAPKAKAALQQQMTSLLSGMDQIQQAIDGLGGSLAQSPAETTGTTRSGLNWGIVE